MRCRRAAINTCGRERQSRRIYNYLLLIVTRGGYLSIYHYLLVRTFPSFRTLLCRAIAWRSRRKRRPKYLAFEHGAAAGLSVALPSRLARLF